MILYNWSTNIVGYLVFLPDLPFLENNAINSASDKGADGFGEANGAPDGEGFADADAFGEGFDEGTLADANDGGFNPDFS